MPNFIDTHAHLFLDHFDTDRDEMIARAIEKGVYKMLLPNVDSTTVNSLLSLCKLYPENCFPMMGLHPTSVNSNYKEEMKLVESHLENGNFIAVGEIGIDLYWDKTFIKEQIEVFEKQIDLALKYNLPIVIHSRDSFSEVFDVMNRKNNDNLNGIFHSFSGDIEQAQKAISYGFKLGIGGVVTFKNSGLDAVIKNIDLRHIVLETDAPYLTPVPYRGKRNESSYIYNIAERVSEIKNISIKDIADITTNNAKMIFNI